jgi:hypothetical protein
MNRFAVCSDPQAETGPRSRTHDQRRNGRVVQIGPKGSRHERLLWAAHKIAQLTGSTEGAAYQMLLVALIEAERRLDPREFNDRA